MTQNELFCPDSLLHRSPLSCFWLSSAAMPDFSPVFHIPSPLPPSHLEFFNAWGIGMNLWPRLWWVKEFIPFAVMWSWWCLCPAPSSLGLVYSSASTTQACLVIAFPNIAVGFSTAFYRYFARHCCWHRNFQLSTSGFHCEFEFFVVWLNEEYSSQLSGVFELWFLDGPSLFCSLFFAASDINFHISGHTSSRREVVCFLVGLRTRGILLVAFLFVERILWFLSMSLTIPFLHARSSNLQYSSPTIHPGMCMSFW